MSKNINQVFIANPITSNLSTDLMYFGLSPYGPANDAAMTFANFSAQFVLSSNSYTNGQILIGSTTDGKLHVGTITAGTNITVTDGPGTITIAASGGGSSFTWINTTSTSATGLTNNGYLCSNAAATTVSLPSSSAVGDLFEVKSTNTNTAGTTISQAANQAIIHNTVSTTVGVGGSLAINQGGAIKLICTVANLTWESLSGVGSYTLT